MTGCSHEHELIGWNYKLIQEKDKVWCQIDYHLETDKSSNF